MPAHSRHVVVLYEMGDFRLLPEEVDVSHFKDFLRNLWNSRHWTLPQDLDEYEGDPSENLVHQYGQALFQFDGRAIRARNYAGFLQYGNSDFYIFPKIFKAGRFTIHTVFSHLHYYLSYGTRFPFPFDLAHHPPLLSDEWLHRLIGVFARQALETVTWQPYYAYHPLTEATPFARGRLSVNDYLKEQIATGQWQQLHQEHSPFGQDNRFNRILRFVTGRLLPVATGAVRAQLRALTQLLSEVSPVSCTVHDTHHPELNGLAGDHRKVLDMCRWFLENSLAGSGEDNQITLAFLVPMERVFEEFMAGFIRQWLPEWKAQTQNAAPLGVLSNGETLSIRNDIWLPEHRIILDSKYKLPVLQTATAAIPKADLYQMIAYSLARGCRQGVLLYPSPLPAPSAGPLWEVTVSALSEPVTIRAAFLPVMLPDSEAGLPDAFATLSGRLRESLVQAVSPNVS